MNEFKKAQCRKKAEEIATRVDPEAGGFFRSLLIDAAMKGILYVLTEIEIKENGNRSALLGQESRTDT